MRRRSLRPWVQAVLVGSAVSVGVVGAVLATSTSAFTGYIQVTEPVQTSPTNNPNPEMDANWPKPGDPEYLGPGGWVGTILHTPSDGPSLADVNITIYKCVPPAQTCSPPTSAPVPT